MKNPFLEDKLIITNAYENNLKNVNIEIPHNQLVVFTGLSGSGKSSLAFNTIYAEGQRRYLETISAYARHFIGNIDYPQVDKITGLSPVISIEQKTINRNPRSTVGTITEIYDFLRLLFARVSTAYSLATGEKMVSYHEKELFEALVSRYDERNIMILAPLVIGRKGHYKELFENVRKQGFTKVRVDGEIIPLTLNLQTDRYKIHDIELIIDSFTAKKSFKERISNALKLALKFGKGSLCVLDTEKNELKKYSRQLMCPTTGISYPEPEPNTFSFNSPYGACPKCSGLGAITEMDLSKIIPDKTKSISEGGIIPLGPSKNNTIFNQLTSIAEKYNFSLQAPISTIPDNILDIILYGTQDPVYVKSAYPGLAPSKTSYEGIVNFMKNIDTDSVPANIKKWVNQFVNEVECPECHGNRLKKESLCFKIGDKNIADLSKMDISELSTWLDTCPQFFDNQQKKIAFEILREIKERICFLTDVGIQYLSLNRSSRSLSGGEAQRIRLATQISSQLVNVLYILDEPSIGLHQRDNQRLISSLRHLRDNGNTIIVVEHDREMMESADFLVDIGPGAGEHGGEIVAAGILPNFLKQESITADYLTGKRKIEIPKERRKGTGKSLTIIGAKGNNLKNISVSFPLGTFICVTGVSGSGKSSLINETLFPILNHEFFRAEKKPLPYNSIRGLQNIDKVIEIDQQPIGKTPRSNPATYVGIFDEIRQLFSKLPESAIRGYKPGRFSFNVKGGRCEECKGGGLKCIEMNFLPDIYVKCDNCGGKRYNHETLEVKYKGKSIGDVLEMNIETALDFFNNIPSIAEKLQTLVDVGMGYIRLGQSSTTLSGGEAQRVKLATELCRKDTGNTLYILDEPTTGLHFHDISVLLKVLNRLIDKGNTVIVIEHNLDVVKMADYIIDMGPEGGKNGGEIMAAGTPEEIVRQESGITWKYLKETLALDSSK